MLAKKRAFFAVFVSVWPIAQQRLNQKLSNFFRVGDMEKKGPFLADPLLSNQKSSI
jgi:hypothetical protein